MLVNYVRGNLTRISCIQHFSLPGSRQYCRLCKSHLRLWSLEPHSKQITNIYMYLDQYTTELLLLMRFKFGKQGVIKSGL